MSRVTGTGFFRAGELAQACGVSTDTLRHYERKGVLTRPGRSRNGYREYPGEAVDRVRLVRRMLEIGFTLDELAQILKVRDRGGAPCREVRELAAAKLSDVEARLQALVSVRDELRRLLKDWDARLATLPKGERAALLEGLVMPNRTNGRQSPLLAAPWRRRGRKGR
ncbi:MAG TPA: heavy metal-responsive transcriptional regulator [Blastocatellia bacterium]|nr:heavy metal-responsive transcriptional regulator [Blastocatellia bacterium]